MITFGTCKIYVLLNIFENKIVISMTVLEWRSHDLQLAVQLVTLEVFQTHYVTKTCSLSLFIVIVTTC